MEIKHFALLAAFACLSPVVGCAGTDQPEQPSSAADDVLDDSAEDLSDSNKANTWLHVALDFNCDVPVQNEFTKKSRRHFYSFPGEQGQTSTFDVAGNWPAKLGARIYVTDVDGNVIATAKAPGSNKVAVKATFASSGKHFVHVSALDYKSIKKAYGYSVAAHCAPAACESDADCDVGESCEQVFCKACKVPPPNVCQPQTLCAQYLTTDGRYYAKNFPAGSYDEAKQWTGWDPEVENAWIDLGHCSDLNACAKIYAPVCGIPVGTDVEKTYGNLCEFQVHVKSFAGTDAESKGRYTPGECSQPAAAFCGSVVVQYDSPTVYLQNFATYDEAKQWTATFGEGAIGDVREGACNETMMCMQLYKPVCGVIGDSEPKTYGNSCTFGVALGAAAGGEVGGSAKGYSTEGECKAPTCTWNEPGRSYIAQSPEKCQLVKFACGEGYQAFFNDCGCGCEEVACAQPETCGPGSKVKNTLCSDGTTWAGPGNCLQASDGSCFWDFKTCPEFDLDDPPFRAASP